MYKSINPATEELIKVYRLTSSNELADIIGNIEKAQNKWREKKIEDKLSLVKELLSQIKNNEDVLAKLITSEMGKAINDSYAEVGRLKLFCEHALDFSENILKPRKIPNPSVDASMYFEPLGIIFAITPWNVPIGTPLRILLPALLSGNGVILKPAPNVAGCAYFLEQLFYKSGFDENILKVVCLSNQDAEELISHNSIKKVAFVGSGPVGRKLASISGMNAKPILLELGGSDPFIVLSDADIDLAANDAANARCTNAGQVCCASKRIIVDSAVYDQFLEKFVQIMKNKKVGDPVSSETQIGPLARSDIRDKLTNQVAKIKQGGSKILLDGGAREGLGFYFNPMVLEISDNENLPTNEELFGPVAAVYRAKDQDHAISIANSSSLGLGACVYSSNLSKAKNVADSLENGFVYINKPPSLNPYIPFGGVKASGYGKDCGEEGYMEYVVKKVLVS